MCSLSSARSRTPPFRAGLCAYKEAVTTTSVSQLLESRELMCTRSTSSSGEKGAIFREAQKHGNMMMAMMAYQGELNTCTVQQFPSSAAVSVH